ncbi:MAG TPA: carbonic anhydrase family protein, partial [Longimicrobium sp.]|nr:carbonic anhydrase family protein [Longimicrobium sp.]
VGADRWLLMQYHFHTPAEHRLAGRQPAMELHLVHMSDLGVAAVAVFIEPGGHNAALEPIAANLPATPGEVRRTGPLNPATLLPPGWQQGLDSFRYAGSLTTPPCGEGVRWFVLRQPILASNEQIDRFRRVMGRNSRPPQPRNGRPLTTGQP